VNESSKSINFSRSYRHEYGVLFFLTRSVYMLYAYPFVFYRLVTYVGLHMNVHCNAPSLKSIQGADSCMPFHIKCEKSTICTLCKDRDWLDRRLLRLTLLPRETEPHHFLVIRLHKKRNVMSLGPTVTTLNSLAWSFHEALFARDINYKLAIIHFTDMLLLQPYVPELY